MSGDAQEDLREFLEELSDIARVGQTISIVSGFHMAWWGGVVACACIFSLLASYQSIPIGDVHIWPITMLLGWIGSRWLGRKIAANPRRGEVAKANRTPTYVWASIGIAASIVTIGEAAHVFDFGGRAYFIVFLLCACGLIMTAAATNERLLLLSGAGWFVIGIISLSLPPFLPIIYGATIIACLVFMFLPGLIIATRKTD